MKKYGFIIVCMLVVFAVSGWIAASAISDVVNNANGTTSATVDTATTAATQGGYVTLPTLGSLPDYTHPSTTTPLESTAPTTTIDTGTMSDDISDYFDFAQTHKPTEADMAQIEENMAIADVIELIGKPHDYGPTSGLMSLVWQTAEGNWYCMIIWSEAADDAPLYETIFEYGYCWSFYRLNRE